MDADEKIITPNTLEDKSKLVQNENSTNITRIKQPKMMKEVLISFLKRGALVFLGYVICYMDWSIFLLLLLIGGLVWLENKKVEKRQKINTKYQASSLNKDELKQILKELPPWVTFPDWERAEWLNEIILQLWPSLSNYVVKVFRGKIQKTIRKKYESFTFEDMDFGKIPPKIDGVKVYNRAFTKDSIIIDFEVLYDGDCDIKCSMSGAQIGRIKDFQLSVEIRVILKPLLLKTPLIGGIQIFFLNTPDINFDLDGVTGFPGLSYFIRQKIEEQITKRIVFPNKFTKRFTKSIEAAELKSLEPEGVLRVHVFEARDLVKKDVTGKSDPYVILNIGAQSSQTKVITRSLNPKWDYWCEFIVLDPDAQQLYFKLYDKDFNEDDFLGSGAVEIKSVIKGATDQWFNLEHVKHGQLHLRFTWLALSSENDSLEAATQEAKQLKVKDLCTALLTVFIDSAENLPRSKPYKKPDPYFTLTIGKKQSKSKVRKHTIDPTFEQGFSFLVPSPEDDILLISMIDKSTGETLIQYNYYIKDLMDKTDLQVSKEELEIIKDGTTSKIIVSLQLRILTNALFVDEEESDTDSEYNISRNNSNSAISNSNTSSSRQISIEDEFIAIEKEPVATSPSITKRFLSPNSSIAQNKSPLGQIEVTISYSEMRQKLVITIHGIRNLPLKDPNDIPDPYVKLKLVSPESSSIRHKTKVIIDNCDPIFEEVFEYLLSKSELPRHKLLLIIKTKKFFSNKNVMGQVVIDLEKYAMLEDDFRGWFDLTPQSYD